MVDRRAYVPAEDYADLAQRANREIETLRADIERVRAAPEEDVWSDRDPHGQLQKYLDALRSNPS